VLETNEYLNLVLEYCYAHKRFALFLNMEFVTFQRKEEDRRQAEMSGCAVDTRHRPSSPPLRTPEQQAPKVRQFSLYSLIHVYCISHSCNAVFHKTIVQIFLYQSSPRCPSLIDVKLLVNYCNLVYHASIPEILFYWFHTYGPLTAFSSRTLKDIVSGLQRLNWTC